MHKYPRPIIIEKAIGHIKLTDSVTIPELMLKKTKLSIFMRPKHNLEVFVKLADILLRFENITSC